MKVVPLPVLSYADDIVAVGDRLTDMIKDGEISSVAVAVVMRDGTIDSMWSPAEPAAPLIGALARIQYRINSKMDDEE